jgi:hypothetical protein
VDLTAHHVGQSSVDEALIGDPIPTGKSGRYDDHAKVPTSRSSSSVSPVQMTLVDDFDAGRRQAFSQARLDSRAAALEVRRLAQNSSGLGGGKRREAAARATSRGVYAASIGISRTLAAAVFGSVITSKPFSKLAVARSESTSTGIRSLRSKRP